MEFLPLFLFFIGLFFGSFFLVLIDRLPRAESFLIGRSKCEFCGHILNWYDLIPVMSFLMLGGKCRYCHKKLSVRYPLVEVLTGILFASVPLLLGFGEFTVLQLLFTLFVVSTFVIIFFIDLKYGIIPFLVVLPATFLALLYHMITGPEHIISVLLSSLLAAGFFFFIFLLTKGRGMGFGDVVLAGYLGMLLSFPDIIYALYIAFLTGACVSLILIVTGRKKLKGGTIPFGPFLIAGAYISLFWGEQLFSWFTELFLL